MAKKTKAELRRQFEFATWAYTNKHLNGVRYLFDAGKLGYCVLQWNGNAWNNQWFDKAIKLTKV